MITCAHVPLARRYYFQGLLWTTFGLAAVRFCGFLYYMVSLPVLSLRRIYINWQSCCPISLGKLSFGLHGYVLVADIEYGPVYQVSKRWKLFTAPMQLSATSDFMSPTIPVMNVYQDGHVDGKCGCSWWQVSRYVNVYSIQRWCTVYIHNFQDPRFPPLDGCSTLLGPWGLWSVAPTQPKSYFMMFDEETCVDCHVSQELLKPDLDYGIFHLYNFCWFCLSVSGKL